MHNRVISAERNCLTFPKNISSELNNAIELLNQDKDWEANIKLNNIDNITDSTTLLIKDFLQAKFNKDLQAEIVPNEWNNNNFFKNMPIIDLKEKKGIINFEKHIINYINNDYSKICQTDTQGHITENLILLGFQKYKEYPYLQKLLSAQLKDRKDIRDADKISKTLLILSETEISKDYLNGIKKMAALHQKIKKNFDSQMNAGNPLRYIILTTIINWFIKSGNKQGALDNLFILFGNRPIPKIIHKFIPQEELKNKKYVSDGNLYLRTDNLFDKYPADIQRMLMELNFKYNNLERFSFDIALQKEYDERLYEPIFYKVLTSLTNTLKLFSRDELSLKDKAYYTYVIEHLILCFFWFEIPEEYIVDALKPDQQVFCFGHVFSKLSEAKSVLPVNFFNTLTELLKCHYEIRLNPIEIWNNDIDELNYFNELGIIEFLPGNKYFVLNNKISSYQDIPEEILNNLNETQSFILKMIIGRTYNEYDSYDSFGRV